MTLMKCEYKGFLALFAMGLEVAFLILSWSNPCSASAGITLTSLVAIWRKSMSKRIHSVLHIVPPVSLPFVISLARLSAISRAASLSEP